MSAPEKFLLVAGESGNRFTKSATVAAHPGRSGSAVIMRLLQMLVAATALGLTASAAGLAALGPAEEQALADWIDRRSIAATFGIGIDRFRGRSR